MSDDRDYQAVLVEVFRKALLVALDDDWDMETCAEAAHVCAAAMIEQLAVEKAERRAKLIAMPGDVLPAVGEVWRERRREYANRTVEVTAVDHSFVMTRTLTGNDGRAPARPVTSRVRLGNWSKVFERVTEAST